METRRAVVATQYRLRTKTSDGKWDINCPAKVNEGTKVHPTEYIETMNEIDNNLHFVIDEQETEKYLNRLEKRIVDAKQKTEQKGMSTAEVLGKLLQNKERIEPVTKEVKVLATDTVSLEELRGQCDELGITYHSKAGVKKLTELLEAHNQ